MKTAELIALLEKHGWKHLGKMIGGDCYKKGNYRIYISATPVSRELIIWVYREVNDDDLLKLVVCTTAIQHVGDKLLVGISENEVLL